MTDWFVKALAETVRETALLGQADVLVAVPTSRDRARKRGYDQGLLLTNRLALQIDLPASISLARRQSAGGFTQSQTARSRSERFREAYKNAP